MQQKLWLCLDASVKTVSLALYQGKLVHTLCETPDRISDSLLKLIDQLLKESKIELSQIQNVLFCNGPGAFTSLRVGLSSLQGLFAGRDIKFHTTSSLQFRTLAFEKDVVCTIGLGREQVACGFQMNQEYSEKVISQNELADFVKANPQVLKYGDPFQKIDPTLTGDSPDPNAFVKVIQNQLYRPQAQMSLNLHYGAEPQIG